MAGAAISIHLLGGMTAVLLTIALMAVAFALGMCAFSAGWFGGGDVKLIAAACGLVSYPGAFSLVLFILAAGAVLALFEVIRQRRLVSFLRSALAVATHSPTPEAPTVLPYGVAIAAGSIVFAAFTLIAASR